MDETDFSMAFDNVSLQHSPLVAKRGLEKWTVIWVTLLVLQSNDQRLDVCLRDSNEKVLQVLLMMEPK